ncbi:MAG TPA: hypothetical protein VFS67_16255 [Polyangiaceae bacterium]|nr:hypothetical protein [Polyangiaceae bacterium]
MAEQSSPDPLHGVARYLSILGHPFVVLPASIAAIAVLRGADPRLALPLALVFVAVVLALALGVRRGRFNDFDVSQRERRPGFYALVILATVVLGVRLRRDPQAFWACVTAGVTLVACGLLNRWIKVSLHTAFALYAAGLWCAWSPGAGLLALPFAAAVAWSRLRLRRHSRAEVLAGAAAGLAAGAALVLLAG